MLADGSGSADPFDDPNAERALLYRWEIEDDNAMPAPSSESAQIEFRVAAARPTTVRLEVTDGDGRRATGQLQLGLTISN